MGPDSTCPYESISAIVSPSCTEPCAVPAAGRAHGPCASAGGGVGRRRLGPARSSRDRPPGRGRGAGGAATAPAGHQACADTWSGHPHERCGVGSRRDRQLLPLRPVSRPGAEPRPLRAATARRQRPVARRPASGCPTAVARAALAGAVRGRGHRARERGPRCVRAHPVAPCRRRGRHDDLRLARPGGDPVPRPADLARLGIGAPGGRDGSAGRPRDASLAEATPETIVAPPLDPRDHSGWQDLHGAIAAVHERWIAAAPAALEDPRRQGAWGATATAESWGPVRR